MPGYLPDGDVHIVTDWTDAKSCLEDDFKLIINSIGPKSESLDAQRSLEVLSRCSLDAPFQAYIGSYVYWITESTEEPMDGDWVSQYEE
jgi:hypothetical protein